MKKSTVILMLLILIVHFGWAQKDSTIVIKSIETKVFKAKKSKDRIVKSKQIFDSSLIPFKIDFGKKEYDKNGLWKIEYYINERGKYFASDKDYYNKERQVIKNVFTVFGYNDSLVSILEYDSKGFLENIRSNKNKISKGNLSKSYMAPYGNQEYNNYYLVENDSLNKLITEKFNKKCRNIKFEVNKFCRLINVDNNIIIENRSYEKLPYRPSLYGEMDIINERLEYKGRGEKLTEEIMIKERKHFDGGKSNTLRKTVYKYNEKDSLIEYEISIKESEGPLTNNFMLEDYNVVSRVVYEYLDNELKTYFFDGKGELERTRTAINTPLKEYIYESGNEKTIYKYNDKEDLVRITDLDIKTNTSTRDYKFEYMYNSHGDMIKCVYFDILKDKPLYIEERIIEYF